MTQVDLLAVGSHPDDVELGCAGTLIKHKAMGYSVGVVDLTEGELSTRGNTTLRAQEAQEAAAIMGASARHNLQLPDGFFQNAREEQLALVGAIRAFRPRIVLVNARYDRHPDHKRAADMCFEACFLSGLAKVNTQWEGSEQEPWRPGAVYHYIQSQFIEPDFVVDISEQWDDKMKAIMAYRSQFYNPDSQEPNTYISDASFIKKLASRANELGHAIGAAYGEGFTVRRYMGVNDLFHLQ